MIAQATRQILLRGPGTVLNSFTEVHSPEWQGAVTMREGGVREVRPSGRQDAVKTPMRESGARKVRSSEWQDAVKTPMRASGEKVRPSGRQGAVKIPLSLSRFALAVSLSCLAFVSPVASSGDGICDRCWELQSQSASCSLCGGTLTTPSDVVLNLPPSVRPHVWRALRFLKTISFGDLHEFCLEIFPRLHFQKYESATNGENMLDAFVGVHGVNLTPEQFLRLVNKTCSDLKPPNVVDALVRTIKGLPEDEWEYKCPRCNNYIYFKTEAPGGNVEHRTEDSEEMYCDQEECKCWVFPDKFLPGYDYPDEELEETAPEAATGWSLWPWFRRRLGAFCPGPVQPHDSFLLPLLAVAVLLLWVGWLVSRRFRGSPRRERRRSSLAEPDLRLLEEGRYRQADA